MKRPEQHVTDTLGIAQMKRCFEPLTWTVNKIENDYGGDYEIEVFKNGQTTGIAFKLQLKSSRSSTYSAVGDFISEDINIGNAIYMCREVRTPILLVHADVEHGRTFWSAVQLDTKVHQALACGATNKSLTFRVPTKNELPATWPQLIDAVANAETLLSLRALSAQPVPDFLAAIDGRVDKDEVSQDLKNKSDAVRLDRAGELLRSGSYDKAREKLVTVIRDNNASVENRFWAWLTAEEVELGSARAQDTLQRDQVQIQLIVTGQLQVLARKGPSHLKFFALVASKAAELYALANRDVGMYLNAQVNKDDGDPFWKFHLAHAQARSAEQVARKYNQCARLAGYAVNYRFRWALPQSLLRIVYALMPFLIRLRNDQWHEATNAYQSRAFQIIKLAAWLAIDAGDDDNFSLAVATALILAHDPTEEIAVWARQALSLIVDEKRKANLQNRLDKLGQHPEATENQEISFAEERKIYEQMATSLGINLSNPKDEIANVVRIGIRDLDPWRVLKNCEHLFISLGSQGAVGNWMRLPTAGSKLLHCTLHGFGTGGLSLDDIYKWFKRDNCDKCTDCSPHPPRWEYTRSWQVEQNLKHAKFTERGQF